MTRQDIIDKIMAEATRQGVPPRWAVAVAEQESGLDPQAVGDNGKSLGLFQLQRAAAIDAGIDPDRRQDLDANIRGGVTYFKQKLAQSKGNIPEALSRYNRGGPTYKGIGDPHYEKHVTAKYTTQPAEVQALAPAPEKSLLARLSAAVTPREASAAETGGLAPGQARPGAADPRDALGERLFGPKPTRQAASPAASPAEGAAEATTGDPRDALGVRLFGPKPTAPAAETFPPLAEQEAAATQQALYGTPAGQTKDAYDVDVRSLTAAEAERLRAGAAPAPAAPTAQTQVELLRQQEAGRLKAEREVGSPTIPASLPVGSQVRGGVKKFFAPIPPEQLGPTTEAVAETIPGFEFLGFLPKETQERIVAATPEASRTAASVGVQTGLTAAGTALGGPVGTVFGSGLGYGAAVGLGLEEYSPLGAGLAVGLPGLQAVVPAVSKRALKKVVQSSRGWKAVQQADEANIAAQKTYSEGVEAAEQAYATQQAEYQAATRAREAERLAKGSQRRAVAQEAHTATEARRAETHRARQERAQEASRVRQARTTQTAEEKTAQQAREYQEQVARYDQAVASQRQAVAQARAIPGRYTPETPSHVIYKKVAEIAPEAPVTLARTQEVAAELQDVLGQVPSLQPSRLQALLTDMRAARSTQSVREVQRYLTDLGTLTRSPDSATRRTAKQLYGALHDDLAESAGRLPATEAARDLLLQANATFRREIAMKDLSRVLGRAITVGDDGIPRIAPGRALTQFDRLVEEDRFFAGSFTPDELTEVRGNVSALTTAQKIPARPGAAPAPVQPAAVTPRRAEPFTPRPFAEPGIPAGERVVPQTTPQELARIPQRPQPSVPPEPGLPALTPREHGTFRTILRSVGLLEAAATGGLGPVSKVALGFEAKDKVADLIATMMLKPEWQPRLRAILNPDGSINEKALIVLAGGRAALMAERKKEQEKKQRR